MQKLLICTQAVDQDDPVLGFFHGWILEFAKQYESIEVTCLKEGRHDLPANVHVHSLGKEQGISRVKYIFNFYRYIWKLRHQYDAVFVHMNQEYVLLGGILWRLLQKKIVLWRNHKQGSTYTRLASFIAHWVCYTSPRAYVADYKNAIQMPIGINTNVFQPLEKSPLPHSILFLGRIDEVKKPLLFIEALNELVKRKIEFIADIYGDPTYAHDPFFTRVLTAVQPLIASGHVRLFSSVTNEKTPEIYSSHEIYVNLTPSGSFDKTIGEAMACGCVVVVSNHALDGIIPDMFVLKSDSIEHTVDALCAALALNETNRKTLIDTSRAYIQNTHTLSLLITKLSQLL